MHPDPFTFQRAEMKKREGMKKIRFVQSKSNSGFSLCLLLAIVFEFSPHIYSFP